MGIISLPTISVSSGIGETVFSPVAAQLPTRESVSRGTRACVYTAPLSCPPNSGNIARLRPDRIARAGSVEARFGGGGGPVEAATGGGGNGWRRGPMIRRAARTLDSGFTSYG